MALEERRGRTGKTAGGKGMEVDRGIGRHRQANEQMTTVNSVE